MRRTAFATSLVFLAIASAAVLAYGTDPAWGRFGRGLSFILLARRLQWPLAGLSLILCVALLGLVLCGKQRVWWLFALLPVVALFDYRFAGDPVRRLGVVEDPTMLTAADPAAPADADPVVGLNFNGASFAFPYGALGASPVVLQESHERRFVLMWSPYANRATAAVVSRDVKPRDLEIVSMPADALLVYNCRLGQFINGLTGAGTEGQKPSGFGPPLDVQKRSWGEWKALHPNTCVMATPAGVPVVHEPLPPRYRVPGSVAAAIAGPSLMAASGPAPSSDAPIASAAECAPDRPVVFIGGPRPVACLVESLAAGATQVDLPAAGNLPQLHLLLLREKGTGRLRVYDRQVCDPDTGELLFPAFRHRADAKKPHVAFTDNDSSSEWTADLKAVEGAWKDRQLRPVRDVDEGVPWATMKAWYPRLTLATPTAVQNEWHPPAPQVKPARVSRRRARVTSGS